MLFKEVFFLGVQLGQASTAQLKPNLGFGQIVVLHFGRLFKYFLFKEFVFLLFLFYYKLKYLSLKINGIGMVRKL